MFFNGFTRAPRTRSLFHELDSFYNEFNRLFRDTASTYEYPAVNLYSNEEGALLTAELPGYAKEELEMTVSGNTLTLRGEIKEEKKESEKTTWYRKERSGRKFSRTIELPFAIEQEKVEAKLENGILEITLPRAESEKPRRIEFKG